MAASRISSRAIEAAERRKKALEMRLFGMTYRKIANNLAMSVSAVHKTADKGLDALKKDQKIAAEKVQTTDRVLKIMERRAKILGLDAPIKVAPTTPYGKENYQRMSETELDKRKRGVSLGRGVRRRIRSVQVGGSPVVVSSDSGQTLATISGPNQLLMQTPLNVGGADAKDSGAGAA